ncbi:MAG: transglycosylase SLT domain-containing protein [Chitinophagaceae bacterium]|nr:transglycosylase SLT domain-containing protein [Chitinophagaceae bacterium]
MKKKHLLYIEKFSENRRAYLIRTYTRSKKYFPKATAILKKHNLPQELKVLLALESAFNGNAVSKAGAVGYWQIMDEVEKEYGLKYVAQQKKEEKKKLKKER